MSQTPARSAQVNRPPAISLRTAALHLPFRPALPPRPPRAVLTLAALLRSAPASARKRKHSIFPKRAATTAGVPPSCEGRGGEAGVEAAAEQRARTPPADTADGAEGVGWRRTKATIGGFWECSSLRDCYPCLTESGSTESFRAFFAPTQPPSPPPFISPINYVSMHCFETHT